MEAVILQTKKCYKCREEKPLSQFSRNRAKRDGLTEACKPCTAENKRLHHKLHPEKARARARRHYAENQEKARANVRKYRAENPEKSRVSIEKWRATNADKVSAYKKSWKKRNPHIAIANCAHRHATKMHACPEWADRKEIAKIYAMARELSMRTGVKHHVDHVVPLRHPLVCGLHAPNNLQAIPAQHNLTKNNKFFVT